MRSFKLTPEMVEEGFVGGTVVCTPAGHAFDIGAALTGEGGELDTSAVISTDNPMLGDVLHGYPGLEECDTPDGAEPVAVPGAEDIVVAPPPEPPTLQNPPEDGGEQMSVPEIPAEHADDTPDGDPTTDPTGPPKDTVSAASSRRASRSSSESTSSDTE